MDKLRKAAKQYKINEVAVAGGVSANNGLRNAFVSMQRNMVGKFLFPSSAILQIMPRMIAITGYFKYQDKDFCSIEQPAYSRVTL